VDEAGAAGAERRTVGVLAELGQGDTQAVDGVQHRRPGRDLDRRPVDGQLHGVYLSSAGNSRRADRMDSGAAWPRPQSEATRTTSESSATAGWSSGASESSMSRSRAVPSRQGVHFPQDSRVLKSSSVLTTSRTETVSSRATMPPVPGFPRPPGRRGSSKSRGGTMMPEGPPTTPPLSARVPPTPPPTPSNKS